MMYMSKKNGFLAEVVEQNEKFGTTMLEYKSGEKSGQTISVSNSTLKRWWKRVEDEAVESNTENSVESTATAESAEIEVADEPEIFHVAVIDEETGETRTLDISSLAGSTDEEISQYNFNPSDDEKHYIEKPQIVKYLEYAENREVYPDTDEIIDKIVAAGGTVIRSGWFITLDNKSRVIVHRGKGRLAEKGSYIEVRMRDKELADKISSIEMAYEEKKSGATKGFNYAFYMKDLTELEVLISELYK